MANTSLESQPSTLSQQHRTVHEQASLERRARRFWVGVIVGLLSLQVVIGGVAIYLSLSDPTVAIVPNYYQAGLDWDVTQRNRERFNLLGWTKHIEVDIAQPAVGESLVVVRIRKDGDIPVEGLRVSGRIFHHARGADVHVVQFSEEQRGDYVALVHLTKPGLWQVDLKLEGDHGVAEDLTTITVEPKSDEKRERP